MRVVILTRHDLGVACTRTLERAGIEISGVGLHGGGKRVPDVVLHERRWPVVKDWDELLAIRPDVVLSADFGALIPRRVTDSQLCVNVHFSLLPRYRGRHGLLWSLINGEREVGFTLHRVDSNIDTGPIYYQHKQAIEESDSLQQISHRLSEHLREVLPQVLQAIHAGELTADRQPAEAPLFVSRRHFRDNYVDWSWPAAIIRNMIRYLRPPYTPGAFTFFRGKKLYLLDSRSVSTPPYFEVPGHVVARFPGDSVWVKTGDGALALITVGWQGQEFAAWELFKTVGVRLGIDWLEVAAKVGVIEWP